MDLEGMLDRIRGEVLQRRVRVSEFFKTYDRTKTKRCTKTQFARALDQARLAHLLTPAETEALTELYGHPSDPLLVNYSGFVDAIEECFTIKGIDKDPLKVPTLWDPASNTAEYGVHAAGLTDPERERLVDLLAQIRQEVQTGGYEAKDFFADFDHNNDGCITRAEFMRNVYRLLPTMTENQALTIAKAYWTGHGINFRALQAHIEDRLGDLDGGADFDTLSASAGVDTWVNEGSGGDGAAAEAADPAAAPSPREAQLLALEAKLSLQVAQHRTRVRDFFVDFDPKRVGLVTPLQFRKALKRAFTVTMSGAEMQALIAKYADAGTLLVRWTAFDRNVSEVSPQTAFAREQGVTDLDAHQASLLERALDLCRAQVDNRRIMLKPTFQDFDRRRTGHVTVDQFSRVLSMFGLWPPETKEGSETKAALTRRYGATDGRHSAGLHVNYRRFLMDIDAGTVLGGVYEEDSASVVSLPTLAQSASAPTLQMGSFGASGSLADQMDEGGRLSAIMAQVRNVVSQKRMRLDEFFQDYDKLRAGLITRAQFYRGLTCAFGRMTEDDAAVLADAFSVDVDVKSAPTDAGGRPMVRWTEFVKSVDAIFTLPGLEKRPLLDVAGSVEGLRADCAPVAAPMSASDAKLADAALVEIAREVREKKLELSPFFSDFDRAKRGYVPDTVFARVLSAQGLLPPPAAQAALAIKFRELTTTGDSRVDCNYKAFIAALLMLDDGASPEDVPTAGEFRAYQTRSSPKRTAVFAVSPTHSIGSTGGGGNNADTFARQDYDEEGLTVVLDALRRQMAKGRIRLHDFLTDGDKLRKGEISKARFRSALGRAGVTATLADLQVLESAFGSHVNADRIDWRSFQSAIGEEDVSAAPPPSLDAPMVDPADEQALERVLIKLSSHVDQKRLHLKPYFRDYDPRNQTQVTNTQMAAVLDKLGIKLDDYERRLLCNAFMVLEGQNCKTNRINYQDLVRRVDAAETSKPLLD